MYGAMLKTLLEGARSTYLGKLKANEGTWEFQITGLQDECLASMAQQISTTPEQT